RNSSSIVNLLNRLYAIVQEVVVGVVVLTRDPCRGTPVPFFRQPGSCSRGSGAQPDPGPGFLGVVPGGVDVDVVPGRNCHPVCLEVPNAVLGPGGVSATGPDLPISDQNVQIVMPTDADLDQRSLVDIVEIEIGLAIQGKRDVVRSLGIDLVSVESPIVQVPLRVGASLIRDAVAESVQPSRIGSLDPDSAGMARRVGGVHRVPGVG